MVRLCSILATQIYLLLLHLPTAVHGGSAYSRADFPADFVFGSGTSAPQYEGAAFEDGRTPSIWDTFSHSGRTKGSTGDVACDGYHKYKDDIRLMVNTGLEAFRISISWSRLIPKGRGPISEKGLEYYNDLITELTSNGIQTHVTLNHLDLPQALEDEYGGWLSRTIVEDFVNFADVCFKEFGDRVLHWTTINEANIAGLGGYGQHGIMAPGRCSSRSECDKGDSSTEPYTVVHNMLLAHSAVARLYKKKYLATQNGDVGLNVYTMGMVPFTNSTQDVAATQRALDFYMGWVINPLIFGDYPNVIKERVKGRIPAFTNQESEQVKGSADFIGLNHYITFFVKDDPSMESDAKDFYSDMAAELLYTRDPDTQVFEHPMMPWGLTGLLEYLKQVYGNPPLYIQENGLGIKRNGTLNDTSRVEYVQSYIGVVLDAVRNGSNTKGYFLWTFLDCLELLSGYEMGFGIYYVDLDDKELKRYGKFSARWYLDFLKGEKQVINRQDTFALAGNTKEIWSQ